MKVAFIGFRHGHISALYRRMTDHPDWEIVAACEEDPAAATYAEQTWGVTFTHTDFQSMLDQVEFDVLAVGDYFSIRGQRILAGLNRGKHIIADKPLCTTLDDLDQIRSLAEKRSLKIGMMLDLRCDKKFALAKQLIDSGRLGDIQAIQFCGAHSLNYQNRPKWYFEENKHGGVINDLGIHGLDMVEYLTGQKIAALTAARTWNAFTHQAPDFRDAAHFMFTLQNGCGVMGDVSYIQPDGITGDAPFSWRFTLWGRHGVMEFHWGRSPVVIYSTGQKEEFLPDSQQTTEDYLEIFRDELAGTLHPLGTEHILNITEQALQLECYG